MRYHVMWSSGHGTVPQNNEKPFIWGKYAYLILYSKITNVNYVFTTDEILYAIHSLKNNKAPGIDGIPAEIMKYCQVELIDFITDIV